MSLLNPTPEELRLRNEQRLKDLEERAARYLQRRRRLLRNLMIAGAMVFPIGCWLSSAGGGSMATVMWPFAAVGGAVFAAIIARLSLGLFLGMVVYGLGCFGLWFIFMTLGWWRFSNASDFMVIGPIAVMVVTWLAWILAGAVFGLISETFDHDNLQV